MVSSANLDKFLSSGSADDLLHTSVRSTENSGDSYVSPLKSLTLEIGSGDVGKYACTHGCELVFNLKGFNVDISPFFKQRTLF
ncbi:hypothetical protein DPMN_189443 [Dreissena polymorpha]|uniref:Uncharacterized protein n=1 Tax=Dreissena polymorpha TaxID=45954 RepID=A0A9D4DVI5_DREPO|nr:hypothetical protein DPMN_189443 [Dreissena polymorpha]